MSQGCNPKLLWRIKKAGAWLALTMHGWLATPYPFTSLHADTGNTLTSQLPFLPCYLSVTKDYVSGDWVPIQFAGHVRLPFLNAVIQLNGGKQSNFFHFYGSVGGWYECRNKRFLGCSVGAGGEWIGSLLAPTELIGCSVDYFSTGLLANCTIYGQGKGFNALHNIDVTGAHMGLSSRRIVDFLGFSRDRLVTFRHRTWIAVDLQGSIKQARWDRLMLSFQLLLISWGPVHLSLGGGCNLLDCRKNGRKAFSAQLKYSSSKPLILSDSVGLNARKVSDVAVFPIPIQFQVGRQEGNQFPNTTPRVEKDGNGCDASGALQAKTLSSSWTNRLVQDAFDNRWSRVTLSEPNSLEALAVHADLPGVQTKGQRVDGLEKVDSLPTLVDFPRYRSKSTSEPERSKDPLPEDNQLLSNKASNVTTYPSGMSETNNSPAANEQTPGGSGESVDTAQFESRRSYCNPWFRAKPNLLGLCPRLTQVHPHQKPDESLPQPSEKITETWIADDVPGMPLARRQCDQCIRCDDQRPSIEVLKQKAEVIRSIKQLNHTMPLVEVIHGIVERLQPKSPLRYRAHLEHWDAKSRILIVQPLRRLFEEMRTCITTQTVSDLSLACKKLPKMPVESLLLRELVLIIYKKSAACNDGLAQPHTALDTLSFTQNEIQQWSQVVGAKFEQLLGPYDRIPKEAKAGRKQAEKEAKEAREVMSHFVELLEREQLVPKVFHEHFNIYEKLTPILSIEWLQSGGGCG